MNISQEALLDELVKIGQDAKSKIPVKYNKKKQPTFWSHVGKPIVYSAIGQGLGVGLTQLAARHAIPFFSKPNPKWISAARYVLPISLGTAGLLTALRQKKLIDNIDEYSKRDK